MNEGLIPQRYAKALYKFALEKGNAEAVYEEMKNVVESFRCNPTLSKALANPFIATDDKRKLLISAAGERVENDYRDFVALVLDNKREEYAYGMALAYRQIYREENNISQVVITTAANLGDAEMAKIRKLVSDSFPSSTLEFSTRVDSDLIGGFIVDVDSVRMDASISNELEQLRNNLISSN